MDAELNAESLKKLLNETRHREEELRKDREALERVARMMNIPMAVSSKAQVELSLAPNRARTLSDAIREAISKQTGRFTIRDIVAYLELHYPEKEAQKKFTTVSSVLGSKTFKGKLVSVVSSGKGIATVYMKI